MKIEIRPQILVGMSLLLVVAIVAMKLGYLEVALVAVGALASLLPKLAK